MEDDEINQPPRWLGKEDMYMGHNLTKKLKAEIRKLKKELRNKKRYECKNRQCPCKETSNDLVNFEAWLRNKWKI